MLSFVNFEQESAMIVVSVQADSEVGTNWIGLCKPEVANFCWVQQYVLPFSYKSHRKRMSL
jgi:hypothetical protein